MTSPATGLSLLALASLWTPVEAQIIVKPGREEFWAVEYIGGDATQPKKLFGWLVLTDSTLSLHECTREKCNTSDKKPYYAAEPLYLVNLRAVTDVASNSDVRGPSAGSKLLLGGLAVDRKQEFVLLVYESSSSAEAPVFKMQKAQSAALEAKIRYRLKHLGVTVPERGSPAP